MAQWAAVPHRGAERAKERGYHLVNRMIGALRPQARTEWAALIDGLGLKPRKAFAPVRVAVTGRTVSPPLYESMELLGRERTMGRLRRALRTT